MNESVTILPDGSACGTMSFPLPKDHWLFQKTEDGFTGPPPMPLRMAEGEDRQAMANKVREAARYAMRASSLCGQDNDIDPDALVQNMVVGLLGYWTKDGLGTEAWENPDQIPPLFRLPQP